MHARPSEQVALIANIEPDQYGASTINTAADKFQVIDMSQWHEVMVVLNVGTMESNATVDLNVTAGSTSVGTGTSVKSITQLTEADSDDDKSVIVNVRSDELGDDANRYLNVQVIIGTASVDLGCNVFGLEPRFAPASDLDLESVDQIVE
ncbi:MAG: hypothetical protein ACFCD0_23860 [Gemmataceae bacterium]